MSTTYTFTGATYRNRQALKQLGARWNPDTQEWVVRGSLHKETLWALRRAGVKVEVTQ